MNNALTPFGFAHQVAHGAVVRLHDGVGELLGHRPYSDDLRRLLGEVTAAMPLLATHLGFEGRINLQFQSLEATRTIPDARTQLMVGQVDHHLRVRAMAKAPPQTRGSFRELLEGGVLALMVEPADSRRAAHQALVLIQGERLQDALEAYFAQSEQLPTLIRLAARGDTLAGFMLQRLPIESAAGTQADWEHLLILAQTLTDAELLDTPVERLLARLFADTPGVIAQSSRAVQVSCNCDRAGISRLLIALGKDEVDALIAEQGQASVTCEFCSRHYRFTPEQAMELFVAADRAPSATRH